MIGFKLPQGARTLYNFPMDLESHPWGPLGILNTPDPNADSESWRLFRILHSRRYGSPVSVADPSLVSFPGLEHPQYQSYLEIIAERNPAWFEQQGLGKATGSSTASTEEIFDAQAWEGRVQIEEEGRRLFRLDRLPDLPGTSAPPPPAHGPAPLPSSLPPLSPLSVRVEQLRSHIYQLAPNDCFDEWFMPYGGHWPLLRLFAIEALNMWRLLRRHLGDTRTLPGRE